MAIIVVGVGLLKTNISTVVGTLYSADDPRRDSGFTTFYMGINIGGALGPTVCGGLAQIFGMRYGFSAAALATYTTAFAAFGVAAIVTGAMLWGVSPLLNRRLHLDEQTSGGGNGESQ